jgi:hypothetical protein
MMNGGVQPSARLQFCRRYLRLRFPLCCVLVQARLVRIRLSVPKCVRYLAG